MAQLFPILLLAIVLGANGDFVWPRDGAPADLWLAIISMCAPVAVVLVAAAAGFRWSQALLNRGAAQAAIGFADRVQTWGCGLLLLNHAAAILVAGGLESVRRAIGNPILLDEMIVIAPPILGVVGLWALHYPVERRIREAVLVRRLDLGRTVYEIPSRGAYVLAQTRVQLLLFLVPLLLIVAFAETISMTFARIDGSWTSMAAQVATLVCCFGIFLFSPLLARIVLSVERLRESSVVQDLREICRRHGVRVNEVLLWKTHGTMINAAVMGLIGSLRYVLVTDALLESLPIEQVRAVLAHEIGHVRRRHMPWMAVALFAILTLSWLCVAIPMLLADLVGAPMSPRIWTWLEFGSIPVMGVLTLLGFGWVSRRFERQADTFAVQHLSMVDETEHGGESEVVTEHAVFAMNSALESVAVLNSIDPQRRSWRHGSIAWRQAYLHSIIGQPLNGLAIDRLVRKTKIIAAIVLLFGVVLTILLESNARAEIRDHAATEEQYVFNPGAGVGS